jgi:hypothetical protein
MPDQEADEEEEGGETGEVEAEEESEEGDKEEGEGESCPGCRYVLLFSHLILPEELGFLRIRSLRPRSPRKGTSLLLFSLSSNQTPNLDVFRELKVFCQELAGMLIL